MALVIGYLVALYYSALHHRMQQLYDSSIRDSLTGLLNRRGTLDAIGRSLARHQASNAMLVVDVDNLKMINDMRGHATGDAVIALTAEAVRDSIRDGGMNVDDLAETSSSFLLPIATRTRPWKLQSEFSADCLASPCRWPVLVSVCPLASLCMRVPTPTFPGCFVMRMQPCIRGGKTAKAAFACSSHPMTTSPIERLAKKANGTPSCLAHSSSSGTSAYGT